MAVVSNWLDTGLLPPCVVSSYLVLMCWQALTSNPDKSCEPNWTIGLSNDLPSDKSIVANAIIAAFAITWTSWRTSSAASSMLSRQPPRPDAPLRKAEKSKASKSTPPSAQKGPHFSGAVVVNIGGEGDSSTPIPTTQDAPPVRMDVEPWQFYFMMLLAGLYMAMVLTGWDSADGYVSEQSSCKQRTSKSDAAIVELLLVQLFERRLNVGQDRGAVAHDPALRVDTRCAQTVSRPRL